MTVCMYVFPVLLQEYRRQHSSIEVKLITGTSQRLLQEIRSGAADLGFITLPVNEPELVTVPAMEEEMLLVAHPSHPLAKKKRIVPQDLAQQPFVLFEAASNSRRVVDAFFIKERIEPRIVMETENVEILKALVRSEMGVTIIPYQAVAREVRSRPAVLREDFRGAPRAPHRMGLSALQQGAADAGGDVQGLPADPSEAEFESRGPDSESK